MVNLNVKKAKDKKLPNEIQNYTENIILPK